MLEHNDISCIGIDPLRVQKIDDFFIEKSDRRCVSSVHAIYLLELKHPGPESGELERVLADIYYCNFSVFQSLPDAWAIDQLFPVMPIHRLNEEPKRRGILADITCDCDGQIDQFIDKRGTRRVLPLHEVKPYI